VSVSTVGATTADTRPENPISPTVIAHSGDVTLSWQVLTRFSGVTLRLYAGDLGGFRLLAEGPAKLGQGTYTYIDPASYLAPVVYQLRWVDGQGCETTIATILRVDARFAPVGAPSASVNRIDSGDLSSPFDWRDALSNRCRTTAAELADLFIPSPEVPPPRLSAAICI